MPLLSPFDFEHVGSFKAIPRLRQGLRFRQHRPRARRVAQVPAAAAERPRRPATVRVDAAVERGDAQRHGAVETPEIQHQVLGNLEVLKPFPKPFPVMAGLDDIVLAT